MSMIEDFQEWKEKKQPFTADEQFFCERYGQAYYPISPPMKDLFKELVRMQKEIDDLS